MPAAEAVGQFHETFEKDDFFWLEKLPRGLRLFRR
jgi:hypothetical protein